MKVVNFIVNFLTLSLSLARPLCRSIGPFAQAPFMTHSNCVCTDRLDILAHIFNESYYKLLK